MPGRSIRCRTSSSGTTYASVCPLLSSLIRLCQILDSGLETRRVSMCDLTKSKLTSCFFPHVVDVDGFQTDCATSAGFEQVDKGLEGRWTFQAHSLARSPARKAEWGLIVDDARYLAGSKFFPVTRNTHIVRSSLGVLRVHRGSSAYPVRGRSANSAVSALIVGVVTSSWILKGADSRVAIIMCC
jgi:hypothetical protein